MNPKGHEPAISPVSDDNVTASLEDINEKLETLTEKPLADVATDLTDGNYTSFLLTIVYCQ